MRLNRYFWQCQPDETPEQRARIAADQARREAEEARQRDRLEAQLGGRKFDSRPGGQRAGQEAQYIPIGGNCGGLNGPNRADKAGPTPCEPGSACNRLDRWAGGPAGRGRRRRGRPCVGTERRRGRGERGCGGGGPACL